MCGRNFRKGHVVASIDIFVVPTISFRLLYGLLILHYSRRELLWLGVTAHPNAEWIARQLTEACGWNGAPGYLVRDRDGAYGEMFTRRRKEMGVRDRPIARGSASHNGFTERLIGSIRRECLDHVIIVGEAHLRCILRDYCRYHNEARTRRPLDKDAPIRRYAQSVGTISSRAILGGFHHHYVRV